MKKLICLFLAVIMAFCALTGCGKKVDAQIVAAASELKVQCNELATYIDSGLAQGYITEEDREVFNSYVVRIDEIINGKGEEATMDELENMKDELAAMASKCAAPNDVVDSFVNDGTDEESTQAGSDNGGIADNESADGSNSGSDTAGGEGAPSSSADKPAPTLSNDFNKLINDFMDIQNEASRKVDMGDVSMDDYTDLLEAGTDLASLKEQAEANGETDEIKQKTAEVKSTIHDIADKMGSSLADNFK